tara:strand:- start:14541 stop:14726 length:186 start_codon:yes stop_codon:yes gene_type:complete
MITVYFKGVKLSIYRHDTQEEFEVLVDDEGEIEEDSSYTALNSKEKALIVKIIKDVVKDYE